MGSGWAVSFEVALRLRWGFKYYLTVCRKVNEVYYLYNYYYIIESNWREVKIECLFWYFVLSIINDQRL